MRRSGATIWLKSPLAGPVLISYGAVAIGARGSNDRVSDLNCFWMARDVRSPGTSLPRSRSGKFAEYDRLMLLLCRLRRRNANTTTRFRRYIGEQGNRPLRKEHDLTAKNFCSSQTRT